MMIQNRFQIAFKGMDVNRAIEAEVRAWLDKLAAPMVAAGITGGKIVVESVDGRHLGSRHRALAIGPDHPANGAHEDVFVAVRNAFRALRRLLADEQERRQIDEIAIERGWAGGRVTFLDPVRKFGWLANVDGCEIYFHGDSVVGGIEVLALGVEVHFQQETGDEGPRATSVKPKPTTDSTTDSTADPATDAASATDPATPDSLQP
jgi:cold shock CspA family protein